MSVTESAIGAQGGSVCRCIGARPQAHTAVSTASRGERADKCADVGLPGIGARGRPAPRGGDDRDVSDMLRVVEAVHYKHSPDRQRR